MGVPGFFLWLIKKYKKEFIFKSIDNNCDYLLIDTNCLIHPVCFKVLDEYQGSNITSLENKMMDEVIKYIEYLIDFVKPTKGVYVAIDGVAPVAKIKQQRSRRFKSIADKKMFDNIKKKYNRPIKNIEWSNSAITPGTEFMERLHNKILIWQQNNKNKIIYSSCFTPAEGEHKLLQFIRNNNEINNYVIYGLDADLIFLALSSSIDSPKSNIYLLREANEINKHSQDILNYVSINIMKESISNTLKSYILEASQGLLNMDKEIDNSILDTLDESNLIRDFIFMCYLLGNDFLPHIPSLDIYEDGIEYLIINYAETMNDLSMQEYLLNNKLININYFSLMINKLSVLEEGILREKYINSFKYKKCNSEDPYDKHVFKIEHLQFKINDSILLGSDQPDKWRERYYKHYWDVSDDEIEEFSKKLVYHYLMGIKWVTEYYFDKCPSWNWYYPFDYPPFISDISKYLYDFNNIKFAIGNPLKPFMQLLAVLPPQLNTLLPNNLRKLMVNSKSSLSYLYPTEFDQDFINKKKYWMGIPKLPPLDIDNLKYYYSKYENELNKEENKRNIELSIFIN